MKAPKDFSLFKKLSYPIVRGGFFFFFSYVAYGPIRRKNKPNLDGPIIWASSHSNFLCDVVVAGYECPRPARFLAKATLFRFPLKGFFTYCGALPLVRPEDVTKFNPEHKSMQNRNTFKSAIEALKDNWPIAIFPEGTSIPSPGIVLPIKAGVAKLAFSAEESTDFNLGLRIIPVGLEYGSRVKLASGLTIRYGKPIALCDYKELYMSEQDVAVKKVMADLTNEMIHAFPHFRSQELLQLGKKLVATGLSVDKFEAAQLFFKKETDSTFEAKLKELMKLFEEQSKHASIPLPAWGYRKIWKGMGAKQKFCFFSLLVFGMPFALWHIAFNAFPEYFLRGLVDVLAADETEQMTVRFILATIFLPFLYALEFWILQNKILAENHLNSFGTLSVFILGSMLVWYFMVHWKKNSKMLFALLLFYRRQERTGELRDEYKKIAALLLN